MWHTGCQRHDPTRVQGVEQLGQPRRRSRALGACSAPSQGDRDRGDGDCSVARHCLSPGCLELCPARRDPYLSSRTSMVSRLYLWRQSRDILDCKTPQSAGNACWAPAPLLAASLPGTPGPDLTHMAEGPAQLCKHHKTALQGVMNTEVSARDLCHGAQGTAGARTLQGWQLSSSAAFSTLSRSTYEVATPAGPGAPNSTDPAWARSCTRPRVIIHAPSHRGYWVKVRGMPIW